RHYRNGILQAEAHESFRTQIDSLAFSDGVGACTCPGASGGSNGRAFAAAEDAAEDCADRRAAANLLSGVLATGRAFAFPGVGCKLVGLAVEADLLDIEHERRTAAVVRSSMGFHHATFNVGPGR